MVKKLIALVFLLATVLFMAWRIEVTARPDTNRVGVEVHGDHEH
jgi:hypothetical protein